MAMRDEDFGAAPTLTEGDNEVWSPPMAAPPREPPDWQSLYEQAQTRAEQERARADAAEGRCEQLRRAERAARSRAGSLKWQLDKSRDKLETAVEEVTEVRRAAEDALFYQAEMTRLEKLLSQAGVDSRKRSTITSLRMEVFQLREALQASEAGKDTAVPAPGGTPRSLNAAPAPATRKETIRALRQEVDSLNRENARLRKALERSQEQKDELVALRRKVAALRRSKRPAQASRPRASAQLRKALERARKQKVTIKALRGEVGSLNRATRGLKRENRRLRRDQERLQDLKTTVRRMTVEARILRGALAGFYDQMDLIDSLKNRVWHLEVALRTSAIRKEELEAELAERPLLSAVFKKLRDRDKTIESQRKEITRRRKANERLGRNIFLSRLRERDARERAGLGRSGSCRRLPGRLSEGFADRPNAVFRLVGHGCPAAPFDGASWRALPRDYGRGLMRWARS